MLLSVYFCKSVTLQIHEWSWRWEKWVFVGARFRFQFSTQGVLNIMRVSVLSLPNVWASVLHSQDQFNLVWILCVMSCLLCKKNCQLGVTHFDNEQIPEEDPLAAIFQKELYLYQNPRTKQSEKRPIFDVIVSQSGAENISESFKMFPPVILTPKDIPHGFPGHFPENLTDFDNKETLPLGKVSKIN